MTIRKLVFAAASGVFARVVGALKSTPICIFSFKSTLFSHFYLLDVQSFLNSAQQLQHAMSPTACSMLAQGDEGNLEPIKEYLLPKILKTDNSSQSLHLFILLLLHLILSNREAQHKYSITKPKLTVVQ